MENNNKMNADLGLREKTIGSHRFEISLLPCGPAGETFIEMMDILGPSIGVTIDKFRNLDFVNPEEDTSFTEVFATFTSKLARGEARHVIDSVLDGCLMDGQPFNKDVHLRGEFSTYISLITFALEANFADFFIGHLKEMGLEIPSLRGFMDMMKKQVNQDSIQMETQESSEDSPKGSSE